MYIPWSPIRKHIFETQFPNLFGMHSARASSLFRTYHNMSLFEFAPKPNQPTSATPILCHIEQPRYIYKQVARFPSARNCTINCDRYRSLLTSRNRFFGSLCNAAALLFLHVVTIASLLSCTWFPCCDSMRVL